jgi:Adenylylsulphate kinase
MIQEVIGLSRLSNVIDRTENIRRVGEVCKLFADGGIVALASFIRLGRRIFRINDRLTHFFLALTKLIAIWFGIFMLNKVSSKLCVAAKESFPICFAYSHDRAEVY